METINDFADLKSKNPLVYGKLVNHCVVLGIVGGIILTLWIELITILLIK